MSEPLSILMAAGPMAIDEAVRVGRSAAAELGRIGVHGSLAPTAIEVSADAVSIAAPASVDRSRYGQYAAPERLLGKEATPQSDVFSLGAILFHAVAGRPPFRGASAAEVMLSICADEPLALTSIRGDVPSAVARVIDRCLARDAARRFRSAAALADALEGASRQEFAGKRILVIDDEAQVRDLYAALLTRIGVDADLVSSGRDAVSALKSGRYDVVMLDLNMPRVSGWEVLDFLRGRAELRPRRLFVITGMTDQGVAESDRELVDAVIYKPVAAEEVRMLIEACLRGGAVDLPVILRRTSHRVVTHAA